MSSSRSRRSAAGGGASSRLDKLRSLREVRDGVTSREEQYHAGDEDDAAIYDEVDDEEFGRIRRDHLRHDNFIVDDDGGGYGNVLEDWDQPQEFDSDDDEGGAAASKSKRGAAAAKGKGKGKAAAAAAAAVATAPAKKRPHEQSIAAAFSKVEAKAAMAPRTKPAPKPTSKDESQFLDSLLADIDSAPTASSSLPAARTASLASDAPRKKQRLIPNSVRSGLAPVSGPRPSAASRSTPFASRPDASAALPSGSQDDLSFTFEDRMDLALSSDAPTGLDADFGDLLDDDHRHPVAPARTTTPSADRFAGAAIPAFTDDADANAMDVDADADAAVKPEPGTAEPAVRKISTVKPKVKVKALDVPLFPTSNFVPVGAVNPASVVEPDGRLLMFYLDAAEINGVVFLFGKVRASAGAGEQRDQWASCCVAVRGVERNMFLLPREFRTSPGGEVSDAAVGPMDVYSEFDAIRRQHRIARFASKFVERNYAFEVPGVPASAQWMKIAYSFDDPALPADLAGETFSHAFGTNTSALELLILKRKLMGPCWIAVADAAVTAPSVSWCKVECTVTDPKSISVLKQQPPAPPITLMALSIKTTLNAKSQQEILTLTTLTYTAGLEDTAAPAPVQQMILVRPPTAGMPLHVSGRDIKPHQSERSLLNQFMANLQMQDPDVLVGHNICGFDVDVLMARFKVLNVTQWSKIGRLRRGQFPKSPAQFRAAASGRLLLDTYLAAKEFIGSSKSYSLNFLAEEHLKHARADLDFAAVRHQFDAPHTLNALLQYTVQDCLLVVALMTHLQCLSLYKQIANTCGSVLSRTMVGGRAERNEFLLLHEFHAAKYVVPDKLAFGKSGDAGAGAAGAGRAAAAAASAAAPVAGLDGDDEDEDVQAEAAAAAFGPDVIPTHAAGGNNNNAAGGKGKRRKPQYAGGLVLEPKRGFYDSYVLLLDFLSLYPSIIREYNICFTTVSRTQLDASGFPPLPKADGEGILPRLITTLVMRRRQVKSLMKSCTPAEHAQYNIRQLALKLTANSMYGCLGFSFSRFYCKPLAALITRMGREILQATVDLAGANDMHVIYGDTDSIMIHTGTHDLPHVRALGRKLQDLVNRQYKHLEIEMDGFYERMLLLKKKKYAAVVVEEDSGAPLVDGQRPLKRKMEVKGLDLVRRDWCGLSHLVSEFILNQLLMSGNPREQVLADIHAFLEKTAAEARAGQVPIDLYVINKGLTKRPREYADAHSQPHVTVALAMEATGEVVPVGATVPYVITTPAAAVKAEDGKPAETPAAPSSGPNASSSIASRARHPNVLARDPSLAVDVEWYLGQQVLPPVTRLCAVIEGTDPAQLAHCLGLDARQFAHFGAAGGAGSGDASNDVQPLDAMLSDEERFAAVEKLYLRCKHPACTASADPYLVTGPLRGADGADPVAATTPGSVSVGWSCPACGHAPPVASVTAQVVTQLRAHVTRYAQRWLVCNDAACAWRTRNVRVYGARCAQFPRCTGRMGFVYSPNALYRQLAYYAHLFDADKATARAAKVGGEVARAVLLSHAHEFRAVHSAVNAYIAVNDRTQVDLASLFSFMRVGGAGATAVVAKVGR
ncbi:DNA-directed DNA polymerase alpha catalytic subunit pol1 [Blastocladiella emersonii ATCC 22665]|nr:DNA-directed DNA polymerase alpha catalytic subunit pol1 [Blastocladiella emersonii ATCC 22665]